MDHSIFMDKSQMPANEDLGPALADKYELWMEIKDKKRAIFNKAVTYIP